MDFLDELFSSEIIEEIPLYEMPEDDVEESFPDHEGRPGKVGGSLPKGSATDTPAFKKWFGKSKVVDENGKPLVVYHGTRSDVEEFDEGMLGTNADHPSAALGFFFTVDRALANTFATRDGGNVMPVYLKITNPYVMEAKDFEEMLDFWRGVKGGLGHGGGPNYERSFEHFLKLRDDMISWGNDGLLIKGGGINSKSNYTELEQDNWVAFKSTQIKSKFNKGTFDPKSAKVSEAVPPRLPIFADGILDRVLAEARVRVRGYTRRDKKTGKVENVGAYERNMHEKFSVDSVISGVEKMWNRKQVNIKDEFKLSFQEKGALGENIMIEFLKSRGQNPKLINHGDPNAPFDIFYDQTLVEVKTGGADNKYDAMKWSLNFGQIRGKRGKKLRAMGPKAKKAFYLRSLIAVLRAKEDMRLGYEKRTGKVVRTITAGLILNHETKFADIYFVPGIHKQIRWLNPKKYDTEYQGTVRYKMKG